MNTERTIIAPSILAADFGRLQEEIASIEQHADWLQVDVMDGHFVPNLSFGAPVLRCIHTLLPLDIHLMVDNPEERIEEFLALKVKHITFHAEAAMLHDERRAIMQSIWDGRATVGIALKPATPIEAIHDVLDDIDLVLVMSVEPGFGGQQFMPEVLQKIRTLRQMRPELMIQVDGGITPETARQCIEAGANNLVAGSTIFSAENRQAAIASLRGA